MSLDAIWNRARTDLMITTESGDEDIFLWEHSARVARNARQIANMSEVRTASPDESALTAAALYHEAGWVDRVKSGDASRDCILLQPLSPTHREQGAAMMIVSLRKLLPADSLARAAEAVRALSDRQMESVEGKIVSDADNLDEFGLLSLWNTVRRGSVGGKGVQAAIDTWHRRREYHFWEARLKDSFQFTSVRTIAQKRLTNLERFMQGLEREHLGADLETGPEGVVAPTRLRESAAC